MIIDVRDRFSSAQAITGSAASTNYKDTEAAVDSGPGVPALRPYCIIPAAFNNLTSLDIALQSDTDSGFATSLKTHWTVNVLLASLTANAEVELPAIPSGLQRYYRYYYTVNGSNPSTGSITLAHVLDKDDSTSVPDAL